MVAAQAGHFDVCQLLLEHGAPWNALDRQGQCAGNYATNHQHWNVVNLLVDAGTRAELILGASIRLQQAASNGTIQQQVPTSSGPVEYEPCTKPDYLRQRLSYTGTALLDNDKDAVMMEWERPLMEAHASILMDDTPGKRVLNVGFGMGIIDTCLQTRNPSLHIIIEAHSDVYQHMLENKWHEKPNVRICFGKWQHVMPQLVQEGVVVDAIFYDTYGEHFIDLEDFHNVMAQVLSKPHGIYSFFNGLAPDNIFFHGVGT
jgi:protein arginine N-methyltransferase 2